MSTLSTFLIIYLVFLIVDHDLWEKKSLKKNKESFDVERLS